MIKSIGTSGLAALFILCGGVSQAAVVGPLNFETGTAESNQYTQNFLQVGSNGGGSAAQTDPADVDEPNNDYIRFVQNGDGNNRVATAINTSVTKSLATSDRFSGAFTMNFDIGSNTDGGSTFGIYLFDPTSANGADSLLVNMQFNQVSETDRIRFSSDGAVASVGGGTQYKGNAIVGVGGGGLAGGDGDADTYYAVNALTSSSTAWTAASLAYTPGEEDDTTLSLTIGTVTVTWTVSNALRVDNPAVAFRPGTYGSGTKTWRLDNIEVVPEPASAAVMGIGIAAMLMRRARRLA